MIIYKDILTGDELFTDSKPFTRVNGVIEIDCKMIAESNAIDESKLGANKSAEEADEGTEDTEVKGPDVVILNRLKSAPGFDKKGYQKYFRDYAKALKAKLIEEGKDADYMKKFETDMKAAAARLFKIVSECDVYLGESENPDGMNCLLDYREDGVTPYMIFIEHGIVEEKA